MVCGAWDHGIARAARRARRARRADLLYFKIQTAGNLNLSEYTLRQVYVYFILKII